MSDLIVGSAPVNLAPVLRSWHTGVATGIGSLPGTDAGEAARLVAGELPDLPHLVELPARGPGADMIGRTIGLLVDIYGDVVPSGWRVSRRPSRDTRRAKDFLDRDLDAMQEHYGSAEWVKLQVCGPWTLVAGLEVPTGHRALTDFGAVKDVAASLSQGVAEHVADVRKRLPGVSIVVQIDEPGLPAVLAGSLPTASGFGRVNPVEETTAVQLLGELVDGLGDVPSIAHCCATSATRAPLALFRQAGFSAVSLDLTGVLTKAAELDPIGEAVEAGTVLLAGILPGVEPSGPERSMKEWAGGLLGAWDRLGLRRDTLAGAVIPTSTCGLAGASPDWARRAMTMARELARAFEDPPEGW